LVEEKGELVVEQLQRAAASDAANIGRSGAGKQLGFSGWGRLSKTMRIKSTGRRR
jgi:hypothetical protein